MTVGEKDSARRLQHTYPSEAEPGRATGAGRIRAARQPRSLDMTLAFGCADLFPEWKVTATGYRPEIDATRWLIAEVARSWADRGFTTALNLETT